MWRVVFFLFEESDLLPGNERWMERDMKKGTMIDDHVWLIYIRGFFHMWMAIKVHSMLLSSLGSSLKMKSSGQLKQSVWKSNFKKNKKETQQGRSPLSDHVGCVLYMLTLQSNTIEKAPAKQKQYEKAARQFSSTYHHLCMQFIYHITHSDLLKWSFCCLCVWWHNFNSLCIIYSILHTNVLSSLFLCWKTLQKCLRV